MPLSEPKYREILLRLADAGVEAIVVGMAAAVIQGAPTMTWDLDVVHHRTLDNVEKLLAVLNDIDAVGRGDSRRLRPNASHLLGPGHVLLETRFGDFDCLGAIDGSRSYEDLIDASVVLELDGRPLLVIGLDELLQIKKRAGRPKDLAGIPYIEATIAELSRKT